MKKHLFLALLMLVSGLAASAQEDSVFFGHPETGAEFPGGLKALYMYLCMNIDYPEEAREAGVEGRVIVSFTIERNGAVSHVKLLKDIGYGCGKAAVKAVKAMPKWKPAINILDNKPVRVAYNLPVKFSLEDEPLGENKEEYCTKQAQLIVVNYE